MRSFRRILPYLRPYRAGIVFGLICVVFANVAGIVTPWLLGRAIDALGEAGVTTGDLAVYAALIVVLAAASGAARFGMRQLLNSLSRRVENDLRDDFFAHLVRLDAGFYNRTPTGDLMSRATNDIQAVRQAVGPGIMYLVNTLITTVLALAVMVSYSVKLTAISIVPLLLLPPVMLHFGRIIHARFERIQDHFGVLSTMVQENLSGVRIVRAYTQEAAQEQEFEILNAQYLEKNMALARTSAMFHPLLMVLTGLGVLVILWYGGLEVMAGRITAGDFVAFFFYLGLLTWPMIAIGWVINLFQRGAASMGRIDRIMDTEPAVREPAEPLPIAHVSGDIEFRNVWFRYPGTERDVLSDVSFTIPAGATAALVGPTGSGKSTIVALITRRFDPTAGEILLDGVPLDRVPLAQLRRAIALVPQDAFVFSATIEHNIALGLPAEVDADDRMAASAALARVAGDDETAKLTDGRVEEAAQIAHLTEAIELFPRGFQTRLGERGVNLSGGQRQRATLARAIARDPRVLILDDALSAVDTHTETRILEELKRVLAARTAVIVSHRVSAVMNADPILVLDGGRIVERGVHKELIASGGLYSSLLRRQLLAEDLEGEALAASPAEV